MLDTFQYTQFPAKEPSYREDYEIAARGLRRCLSGRPISRINTFLPSFWRQRDSLLPFSLSQVCASLLFFFVVHLHPLLISFYNLVSLHLRKLHFGPAVKVFAKTYCRRLSFSFLFSAINTLFSIYSILSFSIHTSSVLPEGHIKNSLPENV